jgi:hypothetical protein
MIVAGELPETSDGRGVEKYTDDDADGVCIVLFLGPPLQKKTHMVRVN